MSDINPEKFSQLVQKLATDPSNQDCTELCKMLSIAGYPTPHEQAEQLNILWENWSTALSLEQSKVVLQAAQSGASDNAEFRKLLLAAIRRTLPPFLNYSAVYPALKVKDEKCQVTEVIRRLKQLQSLRIGCVMFFPDTQNWEILSTLDGMGGKVSLRAFCGMGETKQMPLSSVLGNIVLFTPGDDVAKLLNPKTSALSFRQIATRRAVLPINDSTLKLMAQCGCGKKLSPEKFEEFWDSGIPGKSKMASGNTRGIGSARSITELENLLDRDKENKTPITQSDFAGLHNVFAKLTADFSIPTTTKLAKVTADLIDRTSEDNLPALKQALCDNLKNMTSLPLFPCNITELAPAAFAFWGVLNVKTIESLYRMLAKCYDKCYICDLALRIPLKAMSVLAGKIDPETLVSVINAEKIIPGADLLVWIWKNRNSLKPYPHLLNLLNVDNVVRQLSQADPQKEWGPARRELRKLLLSDKSYQQFMVELVNDNGKMSRILNNAIFLSLGEKQGLLISMSEASKTFKDFLEHGGADQLLGTQEQKAEIPVGLSSRRSISMLKAELIDISEVQEVANREDIKTAAAHGDFKENAEFAAAKEHRTKLRKRKAELERQISSAVLLLMSEVKIEDKAVPGSMVEIKDDNGKNDFWYLVGAYDGDPDKRRLAYDTPLGRQIIYHKKGEEFSFNNRKYTIMDVKPLPEKLIKELDSAI